MNYNDEYKNHEEQEYLEWTWETARKIEKNCRNLDHDPFWICLRNFMVEDIYDYLAQF